MKTLRSTLLALLVALSTFASATHADDIEIYTNTAANSIKPPYTVIVLDLNLLGICNSTLTQTTNPNNPDAPQLCLNITSSIILSDLLAGVTSNSTAYLTNLLLGTATTDAGRAGALCDLYGILGITSPVVQLPAVGLLLAPLLQGVSSLSCGTLSFLLGIPLLSGIVNPLLGGFVGQLVTGLLNPLLTTAVGRLPAVVTGLLNSTFGGILNSNLLGGPNQFGLIPLLESILSNLVNTNVAVMVSHADRSNLTGTGANACNYVTARRNTAECSNGAYMLVGFTPLVNQGAVTSLLSTVGNKLTNMLTPANLLNSVTALTATALTTPTQLLPPFQAKEVYAELMHYLAGNDIYNAPLARWDGLTGLLTRDTTIELANGNYSKPPLECRTANVLNIMLTNNIRDGESDATLRSYLPGLPVSGAITLADVVRQTSSPNSFKDRDNNDINLRSYFLVQNLLTSTATLANTGATVLSYADSLGLLGLGATAASLMKPTLSVDASLLTPSLTLSLSTPGTLRPEAFFSGFRPDPNLKPRWPGNLKKLEVRTDSSGNYQYYDANSALAIAADGRIKTTALSYWTSLSQLGAATADGRSATLGGAGQKIPGYQFGGGGNPGRINSEARRKLFYDRIATGSYALSGLDADTQAVRDELKTDLAVTGTTAADDTLRRQLLLYARGYNVGTAAAPLGTGADVSAVVARDWMHGALLHSRPVAINYGCTGASCNPDIRVVYGAADGFFRMVNSSNGSESWGFMPRVVMSQQKVLRENQSVAGLPYGVDGAPAILLQDRNSSGGPADGRIDAGNANDKAYAYFGLRRSGAYYYAMNLTNPDAPSLLWRIGPDGLYNASGLVAGTATQFAELGLTFSTPQLGRMAIKESSTSTVIRSVLIFGGGYNGGRDSAGARLFKDFNRGSDNRVGSDDTRGNAIYIVNAETGALIWKAKQGALSASETGFSHPLMADSVASDVTAVDTGGDGLIDRLYVADSGGRLWRGDFAEADRSKWTMSPLASIGRHDSAGVVNDRRFFQAPDYVPFRDATGAYDAVVFASGDREDPLNLTTENYLYVFRDNAINSGRLLADIKTTESQLAHQADFADLTTVCAGGAANCSVSTTLTPLLTATGWRLKLAGVGEKNFSQPLTSGGTIFFTTYVPQNPAVPVCEPQEGVSKLYGVSLTDSRAKIDSFATDTDSDPRTTIARTPSLPGEFSTINTNTVIANTQALPAKSKRYYPVYWRERRGDEEATP